MARIDAFLKLGLAQGCSDVHLAVGGPPLLRMNGDLLPIKFRQLSDTELETYIIEVLTTKPKWKANVRLLRTGQFAPGNGAAEYRQIDGGMLCQSADDLADDRSAWKVVTDAQPSDALAADLAFAWAACRFVKSNAIVLARNGALVAPRG